MPEEILTLHLGDVVVLKKKHPCGGYEWTVSRLGADIGLMCRGCGRRQLMPRSALRTRVKSVRPAPSS